MSPRTGRPRTGQTPNISLRINPDAYHAARIEAVTARKTVGQWLEEAINEKIEREKDVAAAGVDADGAHVGTLQSLLEPKGYADFWNDTVASTACRRISPHQCVCLVENQQRPYFAKNQGGQRS